MKPEYRLTRLFFQHIRGTELQKRGVTAEDLAKNLERNGFIQILPTGKYIELPKRFDSKFKQDYFKTIWGTGVTSKKYQIPLTLLCLCLGLGTLVAQALPVCIPSGSLEMAPRLYSKGFPKSIFALVLHHPYQRSLS